MFHVKHPIVSPPVTLLPLAPTAGMRVSTPEPGLLLVLVAPGLVLRVAVIGDRTWSGWWLGGEPASGPGESAEA